MTLSAWLHGDTCLRMKVCAHDHTVCLLSSLGVFFRCVARGHAVLRAAARIREASCSVALCTTLSTISMSSKTQSTKQSFNLPSSKLKLAEIMGQELMCTIYDYGPGQRHDIRLPTFRKLTFWPACIGLWTDLHLADAPAMSGERQSLSRSFERPKAVLFW